MTRDVAVGVLSGAVAKGNLCDLIRREETHVVIQGPLLLGIQLLLSRFLDSRVHSPLDDKVQSQVSMTT